MSVTICAATPADAPDLARIHVASWRATYVGMMPDALLASLDVDERTAMWQARLAAPDAERVALLALDDGMAVGFVCCGRERTGLYPYTGEVIGLHVAPEAHGRGIGRRLMSAAAAWLRDHGFASMMLWVVAANDNARRFYAHLGGVAFTTGAHAFGGVDVDEVAYAFTDVTALIAGAPD